MITLKFIKTRVHQKHHIVTFYLKDDKSSTGASEANLILPEECDGELLIAKLQNFVETLIEESK